MSTTRNEINSNFYQVVDTDVNGNIISIKNEFLSNVIVNAAGSTSQIQFNNNGNFDASGNLVFDTNTETLIATAFVGSGTGLTNILGANVDGAVAVATFAETAGNVEFASVSATAEVAQLSTAIDIENIADARIQGGNPNDVISTDGTGNLVYRSIVERLIVGTRNAPAEISINNYSMTVETRTGNVTVYVN